MKKCMVLFLTVFITISLLQSDLLAQKKLAQTGFQFLSVGTDARATAMGEAFTTVEGSSTALFYNPAGMARVNTFLDLSMNQMTWIADIKYLSGSMSLNIGDRKYGVFGISFLTIDYGEFIFTRVANTERGFEDIKGWPDPSAYMVGLGYAKELSDKFSIGGQVKYVTQNLGKSIVPIYAERDQMIDKEEKDYSLQVAAFDFGTLYKTGFKSLAFGMSVRNFSREVKYEKEGFQLPLTFKIGISMNAVDLFPSFADNHALNLSIDAVHPRDFPEYLNIGGEYVFMNMLALRAGYISNQDDYNFTTGFGVKQFGFEFDYSYTPFDIFDNVNRLSVRLSF